jgi:nitrite reductase/ring-hydroxylating ferredoxin subunit
MSKKPKFKPEITRIALNPEQAVLTCQCYNASFYAATGSFGNNTGQGNVCRLNVKTLYPKVDACGETGTQGWLTRTANASTS